jgi:predicted metalloendopeptidase
MVVKIGYPDKWRDFSDSGVGARSFAENFTQAAAFNRRRLVGPARQARRSQRVVGLAAHRECVLQPARQRDRVPAGILQPPFFDAAADDAVNYGAIGMVIGHEITHGFDDSGRKFDAQGNLKDWWSADDARRYEERAQRVVRQFDAFEGVEGIKVNGKLTLGENISDLGGLKIAYLALQKALEGRPRGQVEGLTPEQRFFEAFAQAWRAPTRTEMERTAASHRRQHSPPRFRVAGPCSRTCRICAGLRMRRRAARCWPMEDAPTSG